MVNSILMIPIHLDALYLKRERLVVEAMADLSIIPYFNRKSKSEYCSYQRGDCFPTLSKSKSLPESGNPFTLGVTRCFNKRDSR